MRKLVFACLALSAIGVFQTSAMAAEKTPLEFLYGIYGHYQSDDAGPLAFNTPNGAGRLFTKDIARLIVKDSDGGTAVGNLDFNPFTCSQDWQPTAIAIGPRTDPTPDTSVILARFALGGSGQAIIHYDLTHAKDGWRIADIHWDGDCAGAKRDLIGVLKKR